MYAQLGNIRFEGLKGFTSFEETFGVNYAQHERIKGKPRLEAVGETLDTISFRMLLHAQFTDPELDVKTLRKSMTEHEILPLILGNGTVLGNFVITNMTKSTEFTDALGNLLSVTLSVDLLESFNDNQLNELEKRARDKAFATNTKNSNVRTVLPVKPSPAMEVSKSVAKIDSSSKTVSQHTTAVVANPSASDYFSGKIDFSLTNIEKSISEIQAQLTNAQDLSNLAQSMPTALQSAYVAVQNMKAVLPISDIDSFKTLNRQLSISVLNVKNANMNVNNQTIIRRK